MICVCAERVADLKARLASLNQNVHFKLNLPPGLPLLAAAAAAALAQVQATAAGSAAMTATAGGGAAVTAAAAAGQTGAASAAAAAQAQATAAARVAADAGFQALAKAAAVAQFKADMKASTGINLASPSARCMVFGLTQALQASGLFAALQALPVEAGPKLGELGSLALANALTKTALGVDLLQPKAGAALRAAFAASQTASSAAAVGGGAAAAPGITAKGSAAASSSALAVATAQAKVAAFAHASAAVHSAFGISLAADPKLQALGAALSATAAGMSGLGDLAKQLPLDLLAKATQLLSALDQIHNQLGVNLLAAGSLPQLAATLAPLNSNGVADVAAGLLAAGGSASASATANGAGNRSAAGGKRSAADGGSGGTTTGASAGASGKGGGSASANVGSSMAQAACVGAGKAVQAKVNALMAAGLASMTANVPAPPMSVQLLLTALKQIHQVTGVDLIALTPCG